MKKIVSLALMIICVCSLLMGCGNTDNQEKDTIKVGSKSFTENFIVAELYALALEDNGYQVERVPNIAGSLIHTAILNREIDLFPEYTGTGLIVILKMPLETDEKKVYDTVKEAYKKQFNLVWLDYASGSDSQGLVIRTDIAKKFNIKTISDLQAHAKDLRFASQGTFDKRDDGLLGLEKVYGKFLWKSTAVFDNSLKYQVLRNNEADVIPAYTTEGELVNKDEFTLLEDDKKFWPPYNLAPVIRAEVLEKHPDIAEILNPINEKLTTEALIELNAKVDVEKLDAETVAKEFYEGLKK